MLVHNRNTFQKNSIKIYRDRLLFSISNHSMLINLRPAGDFGKSLKLQADAKWLDVKNYNNQVVSI